MREKIKLLSSAGTGHFYVTTKNKRLHPDKLEVRKFDPVVRKHVAYKETQDQVRSRDAGTRRCPAAAGGGASSKNHAFCSRHAGPGRSPDPAP